MSKEGEKFVIAVKYTDKNIPRVVAAGSGKLAERILDIAEKHKIEIREGEEGEDSINIKYKGNIPYQAYAVISEILSFVYKLNEAWNKKKH